MNVTVVRKGTCGFPFVRLHFKWLISSKVRLYYMVDYLEII